MAFLNTAFVTCDGYAASDLVSPSAARQALSLCTYLRYELRMLARSKPKEARASWFMLNEIQKFIESLVARARLRVEAVPVFADTNPAVEKRRAVAPKGDQTRWVLTEPS